MKRLITLLLILMLLLCGCNADWEDEAAPENRVEQPIQSEKEASSHEQGANKNETITERNPQKQETLAEGGKNHQAGSSAQDTQSATEFLEGDWRTGGVYLYQDTAYYSLSKEKSFYVYSLKLGKGQTPRYLCEGEVRGIYGIYLLGSIKGNYALMDLSGEKEWKMLSAVAEEEKTIFHAGDRLLIFGEEEVVAIDLKKKTVQKKKLEFEIEKICMEGEALFYSVKKEREQILYRGDLQTKSAEELYRCKEDDEWYLGGDKILLGQTGENPIVLDLKTKQTSYPRKFYCELYNGPDTPRLHDTGDGTVTIQYRNQDEIKGWRYWEYDIKSGKGEEVQSLPSRRVLLDGGSYAAIDNEVYLVEVDGREYRLSGKGISSVNEYGAAYGEKGLIYTLLWNEGSSYELYSVSKHSAP